jgi:hypothetical protein
VRFSSRSPRWRSREFALERSPAKVHGPSTPHTTDEVVSVVVMSNNTGDDMPNTMRESGFRANLHGASLPDLVQMECLSGHERVIRVSSAGETGYLFFRAGQIVHAVCRRAVGEPAALEILRWNDGVFEACNAAWPDRDTIKSRWQNLLLLSAQQRDESGRHNLVPFPGPRGSRSSPPPPIAVPDALGLEARTSSGPPASGLTEVRAAVRLDALGNVVNAKGDASELSQVAAYATQLAERVGDGLGLQGLISVEVLQRRQRTLIHKEKSGNTFALSASPDADLSSVRERLER